MKIRRIAVALAALAAATAFILAVPPAARQARRTVWPELRSFESIRKGMTEAEVVARLGRPYKEYLRETAPADYYFHSYTVVPREITHKVSIYPANESILYVYYDRDNRVEATTIGGT